MQKSIRKINSLTGLRFLAALMIIILHSNGPFYHSNYQANFELYYGVSFFFVLSGFILTFVYPSMAKKDVVTFLKARIARIWPAHMAAILLMWAIMPGWVQLWGNKYYFPFATLMMTTWIPIEKYYLTFNPPSWSVSTEFFFYLCFPLLIYRLSRNWHIKLIITFSCAMVAILMCRIFELPLNNEFSVGILSCVYTHPLSRIFEFTLGMCTGLMYLKLQNRFNVSFLMGSVLEVLCFYIFIISLMQSFNWYAAIFGPGANTPADMWFGMSAGCSVFIALLIFNLAFQKGICSLILSTPVFILLGEMSYSLYLVHNIFITYYGQHTAWFTARMSAVEIYLLFWMVIMTVAYCMWRFVEMPARRFLTTFSLSSSANVVPDLDTSSLVIDIPNKR